MSTKMKLTDFIEHAEEAANLFKSLANPLRLKLLYALSEGEKSVGELANILKARDSTVSQHLALLRKDGAVANRRNAQTIFYHLANEKIAKLIEALRDFYK